MGHYCPLYGTHYNFELDMVISGLKKTHWSSIFCVANWYVSRLLQIKNYLDSVVIHVF